jgi:hypothetical protein
MTASLVAAGRMSLLSVNLAAGPRLPAGSVAPADTVMEPLGKAEVSRGAEKLP